MGLQGLDVPVGIVVPDPVQVLEGQAGDHVLVRVEGLGRGHCVGVQGPGSGCGGAHVDLAQDLGRPDCAHRAQLVVPQDLPAQLVGLLIHLDAAADGVALGQGRVDRYLVRSGGHGSIDQLIGGDPVGGGVDAQALVGALEHHVFQIPVFDAGAAGGGVDGIPILLVQPVAADDHQIGQMVVGQVGVAGLPHVRPGHAQPDQGEGAQRHQADDGDEPSQGLAQGDPDVVPEHLPDGLHPHHSTFSMSSGLSLVCTAWTRASCMRMTLSAMGAMAALWVTMTTVAPFLRHWSWRMRSTCLPVR